MQCGVGAKKRAYAELVAALIKLQSILTVMKLTLRELRNIIQERLSGSAPDETYENDLIDDKAFKKKSVYVPNDIKRSIKKWTKSMGLSSKKKRTRSS